MTCPPGCTSRTRSVQSGSTTSSSRYCCCSSVAVVIVFIDGGHVLPGQGTDRVGQQHYQAGFVVVVVVAVFVSAVVGVDAVVVFVAVY